MSEEDFARAFAAVTNRHYQAGMRGQITIT